jgi:hypothetical protein
LVGHRIWQIAKLQHFGGWTLAVVPSRKHHALRCLSWVASIVNGVGLSDDIVTHEGIISQLIVTKSSELMIPVRMASKLGE